MQDCVTVLQKGHTCMQEDGSYYATEMIYKNGVQASWWVGAKDELHTATMKRVMNKLFNYYSYLHDYKGIMKMLVFVLRVCCCDKIHPRMALH